MYQKCNLLFKKTINYHSIGWDSLRHTTIGVEIWLLNPEGPNRGVSAKFTASICSRLSPWLGFFFLSRTRTPIALCCAEYYRYELHHCREPLLPPPLPTWRPSCLHLRRIRLSLSSVSLPRCPGRKPVLRYSKTPLIATHCTPKSLKPLWVDLVFVDVK